MIAIGLAALALPAGMHRLLPTAVFTFEQHPDLPLRSYAEGRLGLVQPTYARSYLYVAYRWMNGAAMTPEEVTGIEELWTQRLGIAPAEPAASEESYDQVRGSLDIPWQAPEQPNASAAAQFLAVDYVYYSKCADDAFSTAARTLKARIGAFGAASPEVAEWVRGQDYVFENCFGAASGFIPPPVNARVDPVIRADRAYQQAAALFYSSRYEEAAAAFRRVAADASSPWAPWGEYLAGRCTLWEARANPPGSPAYRAKLAQAAAELRRAAAGQAPEARDAARFLLARVLMRTAPAEAASLLSARLLSPLGASSRAAELGLFVQLLDNLAQDPAALASVRRADDLVDWIFTFQQEGDDAVDHATERWRSDGSVAWLAAAVSKVGPAHPAAQELFQAAAQVRGHPAMPMLIFHGARLMGENGERAEAAAALDRLIPSLRGLDSSRNRALSLRATLAGGKEELLFFGARPPAFASQTYWGALYFHPWELQERYADRRPFERQRSVMHWGPETAEILNESVPVDILATMLDIEGQTADRKNELLLAAWTRALLLDRWDLVRSLAPRVGAAVPSLRDDMERLLEVTEPGRMRYFAASGLLKTPGASPLLLSGPIRETPLSQADPNGLNWWPADWPVTGLADYLPEPDGQIVQAEWERIRKAGAGYPWLVAQAIEEAERADAHPSTPETLYRAAIAFDSVDLTWGFRNEGPEAAVAARRRAVEALQRHFSGSEWTPRALEALETVWR